MRNGVYNLNQAGMMSSADLGGNRILGMNGSLSNYIHAGNAGSFDKFSKKDNSSDLSSKKIGPSWETQALGALGATAAIVLGLFALHKTGSLPKIISNIKDALNKAPDDFKELGRKFPKKTPKNNAQKFGFKDLWNMFTSKFKKKNSKPAKPKTSFKDFWNNLVSKFKKKGPKANPNPSSPDGKNKPFGDLPFSDGNKPKRGQKTPKIDSDELDFTPEATGGASGASAPSKPIGTPDINPQAPEVKPQAPEVKPSAPEVKPQTPDVKPQTPEAKPSTPEVKPVEPEIKPVEPDIKPQTPEIKPQASEVKPVESEIKPQAAEVQPDATSIKPQEQAQENKPQQVIPGLIPIPHVGREVIESKPVDPHIKQIIQDYIARIKKQQSPVAPKVPEVKASTPSAPLALPAAKQPLLLEPPKTSGISEVGREIIEEKPDDPKIKQIVEDYAQRVRKPKKPLLLEAPVDLSSVDPKTIEDPIMRAKLERIVRSKPKCSIAPSARIDKKMSNNIPFSVAGNNYSLNWGDAASLIETEGVYDIVIDKNAAEAIQDAMRYGINTQKDIVTCGAYGGITPEFILQALDLDVSKLKTGFVYDLKYNANPKFKAGRGYKVQDVVDNVLIKFRKNPSGRIECWYPTDEQTPFFLGLKKAFEEGYQP